MLSTLSLNGPWRIRWSDSQRGRSEFANHEQVDEVRYFDATVPGEVHLDLMRQGIIGDVHRDTHCLSARWVEEMIWSYRREFTATPRMLNAKHVWLHFAKLDLVARIVLNGVEVGRHADVFYPCRVDISGKLHPGKNVLAVHLDSGFHEYADKPQAGFGNQIQKQLKRHWQRKPQCQFAWDWAQQLSNVGISGDVQLEWSDDTIRADQFVPLATVTDDLATGKLTGRLFVEGLAPKPVEASLELHIEEIGATTTAKVSITPGLNPYELSLELANPSLWWPVGHGPQNRYTCGMTLKIAGRVIAKKTAKIGFRHVRINQDKHPLTGQYFIIEVNRKPIFCKGGNFVPADMISVSCDRPRYEKLISLALEANLNMLRIWGGGTYESDDFYDLCDEKGILVWQEFVFACGKYPGIDQEFFDNFKIEARYNIRRLASHPSLVFWCGNNEMQQGNWDWGYDKGVVYPDYAIFHLTLPRLMAQEDPTRYYQPSSPFSPGNGYPNANEAGDQHPWFLGFFDNDYRKYRPIVCRFPNEGGSLGPTSLPTMLACMPAGQQHIQSFAWQIHDNSVDSWAEKSPVDAILDFHLGRDIRQMSLPEYALLGGLVQGEALKEFTESFRKKMFDCAAAIFWMYNDTWPCTRSWTIADYYLRRTPAFWSVKRSMQPVHVVLSEEGDEVVICGINDTTSAVTADLRYGLFNLSGGYPLDQQTTVILPPNASTPIARFPRKLWRNPRQTLAFAMLSQDGKLIARNRLILPLLRELKWPHPEIKLSLANRKLTFTSKTFAWGVCLDLDGETALPDNLFDLYPGIPYTIPWNSKKPPRILGVGNLSGKSQHRKILR